MLRTIVATTPLLLAIASAASTLGPQERTKKVEAKNFPTLVITANAAWEAGQFGTAAKALQDALTLVNAKRREVCLKAFPPAPEGWEFKPNDPDKAENAMFGGMVGITVEGNYRGPDDQRLSLTATIDSPMVQMMAMMINNPAMLGDKGEIIKYGKHTAVLQKKGATGYDLSILIGDDIVVADAGRMTDDALLGIMSQAVVDGFEAALKD